MADIIEIEMALNRAIYAMRGLAGLLIATGRSEAADCVDFECVGELTFLVAEQASRATDALTARLHER
jgi:hypothetical protein